MAILFQDGFDHYGDGAITADSADVATRMTQGLWADANSGAGGVAVQTKPASITSFSPRTGIGALYIGIQTGSVFQGARLVLPSTYGELFFHFGLYAPVLPPGNGTHRVLSLRDNTNTMKGELFLQSDGSLEYKDSTGTTRGTTAANTVVAGTWNQLQIRVKKSATVGAVVVKLNGVTVMNAIDVNTGADLIAQVAWHINSTIAGAEGFFIDDLVINDTSGARNTSYLGDVRVATLYPRADDEQGWTAQRRYKYGNGICQFDGSGDALTCADAAAIEIGSSDFTYETWAKFLATPTGSNRMVLGSKWRESTNERSWRFFLGGPSLNNGHLEFQVSSDGTSGTVTSVASAEWTPVYGQWHHIVVQRKSGKVSMFVDGVPLNAPVTDSATYNDNSSLLCIGGQQSGATSITSGTEFNGFLEEVRFTIGTGRYNETGFTVPSAAFPRSVGAGDASFANVVLLLGFDTALTDESSYGRAVTARGNAARYEVDDAPTGDYKTVNQTIPRDDTSVYAPYVVASGVLTATANFANNETVTFDGNTYTFKTALTGGGSTAGEVLIGAALTNSIDNLVAAINAEAGAGTLYGTGTAFSTNGSALNIDNGQMRVEANTPGTAGNSIDTTETCANAAFTAATLTGGLDIPGPSSFFLTRLPAQSTGIKGLTLLTRAAKTDAGDANVQASFVTADDSTANGADRAITTSFTWYADVIETDPGTSGALTPSSFIGARFRIDRTA